MLLLLLLFKLCDYWLVFEIKLIANSNFCPRETLSFIFIQYWNGKGVAAGRLVLYLASGFNSSVGKVVDLYNQLLTTLTTKPGCATAIFEVAHQENCCCYWVIHPPEMS